MKRCPVCDAKLTSKPPTTCPKCKVGIPRGATSQISTRKVRKQDTHVGPMTPLDRDLDRDDRSDR